MKQTLCVCLIALVTTIKANSISIANERSTDDVAKNADENSKVTDITKKSDDPEAQNEVETREDTPSDMGTRGLFSGYRGGSRFRDPFSRSPWSSSKYMSPPSPFFDEFDSLFFGNSLYGDEDGYSNNMGYNQQYPGMYGRYGMMSPYDVPSYPSESQGRYPAYNQQVPTSSSYYGDRPGETSFRPQEYNRGQPGASGRFPTQGTPHNRNRMESNVQPERPQDRNQPSTAYYQDQRRNPQQFATLPSPYIPEQRGEPASVPNSGDRRDQPTNSNDARLDNFLANGNRRGSQSTVVAPESPAPVRDQQRIETSSTAPVPGSPDERIQHSESDRRP